jgi:diguanylate cyclase (GGDEF)-like protein
MQILKALEAIRQLSDGADPASARIGSLWAAIHAYHLFAEIFLVVTMILVLLLLCSTVWMFRLSRNLRTRQGAREREVQVKNQQIQMLQHKVSSFEDARNSYLNLITNMSFVMRNIDFRQKLGDLAGSISSLVKSILQTDVVEFYTYDPEEDLLKRVDTTGQAVKYQLVRPLGKGLVGTAARDGRIITNEYFNRRHLSDDCLSTNSRRLWMAAPIQFEKQILGVIAIGEPSRSNGTEKDLLSMVAQIAGVVLYHQSFLIRARRNADTDVLTGLHNRRYFYRMSRRLVEKAIQEHTPVSILLIDVDHFKHYNDTNGHDEGDRLLIEFSGLLRGCTPDDAVVARYGGEEFIVVLPKVPTEDAWRYGEYLRNAVANHPFPHKEKQPSRLLTISVGSASFPHHGRSIQEVVRLADSALYRAKAEGRNRVCVHSSSLFVTDEIGTHPSEDWEVQHHPAGDWEDTPEGEHSSA